MNLQAHTIERLTLPVSDADLRQLAELLVDTVEAGSAVSFVSPLSIEKAEAWWRQTITGSQGAVFLIARDANGIVGTVQLHRAWAPNQPHRGEIAKLMVHPRARRSGVATQLMQAIETEARRTGLTLLTLDTKRGEGAEVLYRRTGWTVVGVIPNYAVDPDGKTLHDTVVFYKELTNS